MKHMHIRVYASWKRFSDVDMSHAPLNSATALAYTLESRHHISRVLQCRWIHDAYSSSR